MTDYCLLAADMDGTLLRTDKTLSRETLDAIDQAEAAGNLIVLSTGRALTELGDYSDELEHVRYGILASGALIYDFKEKCPLQRTTIPVDLLDEILTAADLEDVMIQGLGESMIVFKQSDFDHIDHYHMAAYKPMYERMGTFFDDVVSYMRGKAFNKVNLYHTSPESRDRTYARLKHLPLTFAYAEATSLEISPDNVSKGKGLKDLCDYLGVPLEKTIAVGDGNNDLDIFAIAGLAVAVANANDRVKKAADVIVSDNDHDGVKEAIERFLNI